MGNVSRHGLNTLQFRVSSIRDLEKIKNHFDEYPLITQKRADFKFFMMIFYMIKRKVHLTKDGIPKIVALKASINLGLSEKLKSAFPDVVPVVRPLVEAPKTIDLN